MGTNQTHAQGMIDGYFCFETSYAMMRKCWVMSPDDRPTFKELYSNTSKYIERIAGYLDLGYNPFTGVETKKWAEDEEEFEPAVAIQVTPASLKTNFSHTIFTNTQY